MGTKATNKHCANTKHGSAFSTLTAAQAFCLQQGPSACSGVYDDGCDGKGSFYACKVGVFDSSSIGSCIYTAAKNGVMTTPRTILMKGTTATTTLTTTATTTSATTLSV